MIRNLEQSEIEKIKEIHAQKALYPFPDLASPLYCVQKTLISDEKIIGAAFVHLTSEISIILDGNVSKVTKSKLVSQLFPELYGELRKLGLMDTHVFVTPETNNTFAELLIKNFGFSKIPGIALERWYDNGKD